MDTVIGGFSLDGLWRHSSKDVQQRDTGLVYSEKTELRTGMCELPACCGNEAGLEKGHLGEKRLCFNGLPRGEYAHTREAKERSRNIRGKAEEWWQRGVVLQDESTTSGDVII